MKVTELESKNFYQRLGLELDATVEQIKDAYKDIAKIYHPDSNYYDDLLDEDLKKLSAAQEATFRLVTEAYNTLVNNERRGAYDLKVTSKLKGEWSKPDSNHKPSASTEVNAPTGKKVRTRKTTTEMKISIVSADTMEQPGSSVRIQSVADMINSQRVSQINTPFCSGGWLKQHRKTLILAIALSTIVLSLVALVLSR